MKILITSNGIRIKLEDQDYNYFNRWSWWFGTYAQRGNKNGRYFLHVEIAKRAGLFQEGKKVDHIDFDKTNCCRDNLRPGSHGQNRAHSRQQNNQSDCRGVYPKDGGYEVSIRHDKILNYIGFFKSKKEAARAYNNAAIQLHGEFAVLNDLERITNHDQFSQDDS